MKKYIVFLSVVVFVGFLMSLYSAISLQQIKKEDLFENESPRFELDNLEITHALLKLEDKVLENPLWEPWPKSNTGEAKRILGNRIYTFISNSSSYSCDTDTYYITPVCERAIVTVLKGTGVFHHRNFENKSGPLVTDEFINRRFLEAWSSSNSRDSLFKEEEQPTCKEKWIQKNKERDLNCARIVLLSKNSVRLLASEPKNPNDTKELERIIRTSTETPITDHLKK